MIPTREHVLAEFFRFRAHCDHTACGGLASLAQLPVILPVLTVILTSLLTLQAVTETIANFFGLQDFLNDHFQRKVDVITVSGLKPFSRDLVMRDAVFLESLHEKELEAEKSLSRA